MPYKIILVPLTEEQIAQIVKGVGPNGDENSYALFAEPKLDKEMLNVQVVTQEQYDILRPAILKAHKLPPWKSRNAKAK